MINPADEQRRRNLQSRDAWGLFGSHRRHVTRLLVETIAQAGVAGGARLCLLGAGNCNDLDLARLTPPCAEIHLVDLDGEALVEGLARQAPPHADRIRLHGDVDLSGLLGRLPVTFRSAPLGDEANRESLVQAALEARPGRSLPAPFDIVASVCLLSQLLEPEVVAVAPNPRLHLPLIQALRLRHLQLLVEWLRPGGRGLLVTDIVSSVTCPTLASTPTEALPALLRQLVAQQNFFTGLNPGVIEQQLRTAPNVGDRLENVVALPPWLWDLGPRVYAVCAWSFVKMSNA